MKKINVLFVCLTLVTSATQAQTFDFEDLSKINGKIIPPAANGQFTTVSIENINTLLYKVEIDGEVVQLETPVPTELQTLFRLSAEDLNDGAAKAKEGLETTKEAVESVNSLARTATDPTLTALYDTCDAYLAFAQKLVGEIAEVKFMRMQLINLAKEDLSGSDMSGRVAPIYNEAKAKSIEKLYIDFEQFYFRLENQYSDAQTRTASANQNTMEDALKKIEKGFEKIKSEHLLTMISEIGILYNALTNPKNFKVVSPPIQMDGDYTEFTIKITPTPVNTLGPYRHTKAWTVQVPAKGGWKADFGVGPALSFGEGARDERYYLSQDSMTVKANDNNNAVYPGIAAMMHFYPRTGTHAAYGFTLGVGAGFKSFNDVNASAYLGGSIILGKYRKIAVSSGLSYLRVDRLKSPQYQADQRYTEKITDVAQVTAKIYRPSIFLAVTYSLATRTVIK